MLAPFRRLLRLRPVQAAALLLSIAALGCDPQPTAQGGYGQPCFANRTCSEGFACSTENICEPCTPGSRGCICDVGGTCENGLLCEMNVCSVFGVNSVPPADPKCFSPCRSGFVDASGEYRACSAEGLMEGCLDDAECVEGSCVLPGEAPAECVDDTQCPEHQLCIQGQCYANCDFDSECGGLMRCYQQSCRIPCAADDASSCYAGTHCRLVDGDHGFCMPTADPDEVPPATEIDGTYSVSEAALSFSNIVPSRIIRLRNDSPRPIDFTVRKVEHRVFTDAEPVEDRESPMPWLGIGAPGATENGLTYQVRVAGNGDEVEIELSNAASGVPARWEGAIAIESELGDRRIPLTYAQTPDGRWVGKVYYFSQFGDHLLDEWLAGTVPVSQVNNAFLQKWSDLRAGNLSVTEFLAVLSSTLTESWRWPSTISGCKDSDGACYPSVNTNAGGQGLGNYSSNLGTYPVPSGVVELPIALDLRQDGAAAQLSGRIASEESLHYAGNPEVTLAFAADPSSCASSQGASCVVYVSDFSSTVVVGGRAPSDSSGASCKPGFVSKGTPWIVPGFLQGTEIDPETGLRYRYECRDEVQPFANAALNASLAGANPIPDGRRRVRVLNLVDGALVNQEHLYVIFEEMFDGSFLGAGSPGGFSAYGLMALSRTNATLKDEDFTGVWQSGSDTGGVPLSNGASCTEEVLSKAGLQLPDTTNEADTADQLARTLLYGAPTGTPDPASAYTDSTRLHYLCHETGFFDGGPMPDGDRAVCPPGSPVTYFYCADPSTVCVGDLRSLACQVYDDQGQAAGTCQQTLNRWVNDPAVKIVLDPFYRCSDGAYCDADRTNLLAGKVFYDSTLPGAPVFLPLETAIDEAFRYKTQFRNREGRNIGFAPDICVPGSTAVPYCYSPEATEEIRDRVSCLAYLFTDPVYYAKIQDATLRNDIADYLELNFSYIEEPDPYLPQPIVHDGFERLYSELLIMLGDEAYTSAFQSRFDLAGASLVSFEGSLFEAEGIDLSGVAGYEMYTLYQATQYYQLALDRFYALLEYVWASLERGGDVNFVTQEMVTSYLGRVLRASTQRARAYSEIARRYQRFNRADLARNVIERAYTSGYLESVVITRMIERIIAAVAQPSERPQLVAEIDHAARVYRIALLDMRELYGDLTDELNYFGFAPDYIPIPALDPNGPNSFEALLGRAQLAAQVAAQREQIALDSNRSYETDAAAFQSELTTIRNTYENQLAELCGTFVGDDQRVYPAIRKYAHLNARARGLGDPCGLMGNGAIHQALGNLELNRVDIEGVVRSFDANDDLVLAEEDRITMQCALISGLADIKISVGGEINSLSETMRAAEIAISTTERTLDLLAKSLEIVKCDPPTTGVAVNPGTCVQAIASAATFSSFTAGAIAVRAAGNAAIEVGQRRIDDLQLSLVSAEASTQCEQVRVDSIPRLADLTHERLQLELEAVRADYRARLTMAEITRLRQQALRIEAEQEETEQLAINVQAARNDPNVRIYKNDAIINADVAFDNALRAAYRATRVFEYYTSQSYPGREELTLVRMVSRSDHNLENYLIELENAYFDFLEVYGRPDTRVDVLSLRDDLLQIPRYDDEGRALTQAQRIALFREALTDPRWLNARGHLSVPFATQLARLSPLTRNHKIARVEAEVIGSDVGDAMGRVYISQAGTSQVQPLEGMSLYYRLPERTAVVNPFFNGVRVFEPSVYQNDRLRDRPYVNTSWELVLNQRDELVNQDINLNSLTDIRVYVYYSDFTAL